MFSFIGVCVHFFLPFQANSMYIKRVSGGLKFRFPKKDNTKNKKGESENEKKGKINNKSERPLTETKPHAGREKKNIKTSAKIPSLSYLCIREQFSRTERDASSNFLWNRKCLLQNRKYVKLWFWYLWKSVYFSTPRDVERVTSNVFHLMMVKRNR